MRLVQKSRYGDPMNPLIAAILTRTVAGAITAAATPTVMNMEPTAPVPATMEDAIAQVVAALLVVGGMYLKKLKDKKAVK